MEIKIRKAKLSELEQIDRILASGREYLHARGLPQWQNGYGPTRSMAEEDIRRGDGYVLEAGGVICGYAAMVGGIEESYANIRGEWDETHKKYITIHRVAINASSRSTGLSGPFMRGLIKIAIRRKFRDIRIDTYPRNEIMQRVILRAGFTYRGTVQMPIPDGERLAYQLVI
jgi:RimJ/RimL family protein N-acetyltransferase